MAFAQRSISFSSFCAMGAIALMAVQQAVVRADDWPQWLGPKRDGVWRETGVLDKLPEGGPAVLWRKEIGAGYSGPAVAEGRVYVTDHMRPPHSCIKFFDQTTSPLAVSRHKRYEEISKAHLLDPSQNARGREVVWSHPAFANRCIFARNDKEIICASLAASGGRELGQDNSTESDPPKYLLKRDSLALSIFLPDAEKGYYRGTRFDWSGLIGQAEYKGHTFFGPWKTTHDPKNHDDADGTAEEFGIVNPAGYVDAKVGGVFLKIGVGLLEKPKEDKYQFWKAYKILDPGVWKVSREADAIAFRHEVKGDTGWGYRYSKRITLAKAGDGFRIEHTLENTGQKAIETDHYCHNFIRIDDKFIGPDYRLEFPFEPKPKKALQKVALIKGKVILFESDLKEEEAFYTELEGSHGRVEDNQVLVTAAKPGAALQIQGDVPLDHCHVFGVPRAICPELFIKIDVAPEKTKKWKTEYTFFVTGNRLKKEK